MDIFGRGQAFTTSAVGVPWSSQAQRQQSTGLWAAAENLLAKIRLALTDGDTARAEALATRAAALPWDEHEEIWPGVTVAAQQVFNIVTDVVEEWPEDDQRWIAVLEQLAGESDLAHTEMSHIAAVLAHTMTLVEISPQEQRRLARLAGDHDGIRMPSQDIPREDHVSAILELARIELRVVELGQELAADEDQLRS